MKRVLAFMLAVLILLSFAGCTPPAGNVNPELFVVASHSLLGVLGRDREDVFILEEDDFDRVMFAYLGHTVTSDRPHDMFNILAVAIVQRTTRRYSYFYDGMNVIFREIEVSGSLWAADFLSEEFVMEYFTEEQLEQLREENSWNEELNEDRLFRVRVARGDKRRHLTYVPEEAQEAAIPIPGEFWARRSMPLTMDKNENVIYFMRGWDGRGFLLMFDSDGDFIEGAVMELYDLWDYRDQLREFKEAHGWSFTYR